MWKRGSKRRKRRAGPTATQPLELCDLCAAVVPADTAVRGYAADSSSAHAALDWFDGLRPLTACDEDHLERLREEYRRRPFVEEELWAAKIARVLGSGPPALGILELACRTGLHESEIRRALAWHNRRRQGGDGPARP
ncbi:hypothetical protein ACIQVT_13180 [Streptomyces sp. NPDC100445]|uniref:hypothetical protein n=1 Tax=Streptomyces sp. NPDC100445 TaxID=3366102 RepID=UPI00380826D2